MGRTTVFRTIDAPVEKVFNTVAHAEHFLQAVPQITKVEFATDQHSGEGTRFAETRVMKGREATTELEVTEYVPNERVRMVSDEGNTIWDTTFALTAVGDGTTVEATLVATAYSFTAKIMNAALKSIIRKAIEGDLDAVKAYCERTV